MVSIAELEKLKEDAKEAQGASAAATEACEKAQKEFDAVKNKPEMVIRLAVISEREKERDETAQGAEDIREAEDIKEKYNETIRALKRNPRDSIRATILTKIMQVARTTKTQ
jgi:hypothetical protein